MSATQALLAAYVDADASDVARQVERLAARDVGPLLSVLGADSAALLLPHLAPATAVGGLAEVDRGQAATILGSLEPDLAVSYLRQMQPTVADEILAALPDETAAPLRSLLAYPPESAGGVMDPLVLTAPFLATVAETRMLIERHPAHLYYYVYVVDTTHRLAGVVDLAELLQADAAQPLRMVTRPATAWLVADLPLQAVFEHVGWQRFDALPVVDSERRFLGIIRHRRMRQLAAARQPVAPNEAGVRTVMALGEVYWLGLCGLLQGIASTASAPDNRPEVR
jgi:magnesium transporter